MIARASIARARLSELVEEGLGLGAGPRLCVPATGQLWPLSSRAHHTGRRLHFEDY